MKQAFLGNCSHGKAIIGGRCRECAMEYHRRCIHEYSKIVQHHTHMLKRLEDGQQHEKAAA